MEESAAEFFPSNGDNFLVEDLLDFSNEDEDNDVVANEADGLHSFFTNATESNSTFSNVTDMNSYNSNSFSADSMACFNFTDSHFSSELSVPHDDFAELEWLSNIQEESFSIEEMQRLQIISGASAGAGQNKTATCTTGTGAIIRPCSIGNDPVLTAEMRKARSKRSRPAPCKWKNEVVSAPLLVQEKEGGSSSVKKSGGSWNNAGGEGRKCLHCATDKTPQWRTGPMGPKTLCNACGVRYKSGRLVPEYRPAASPTFVLTKHSNSHRKVMELRRQKEMMKGQHIMMLGQHQQIGHDQEVMFDECNGSDEFLIHQHVGHGYRQMM